MSRENEKGEENKGVMAGQEGESEIFVRCVVGIKWGRWWHMGLQKV